MMKRSLIVIIVAVFMLMIGCGNSESQDGIVGYYQNTKLDFLAVNEDGTYTIYSSFNQYKPNEPKLTDGTYEAVGNDSWIFKEGSLTSKYVSKDEYGYGIYIEYQNINYLYYRIDKSSFENGIDALFSNESIDYISAKGAERIKKNSLEEFKFFEGKYSYTSEFGNEIVLTIRNASSDGFTVEFENSNIQEDHLTEIDFKLSYIKLDEDGGLDGFSCEEYGVGDIYYNLTFNMRDGLSIVRSGVYNSHTMSLIRI